jgi:hypothetical protein
VILGTHCAAFNEADKFVVSRSGPSELREREWTAGGYNPSRNWCPKMESNHLRAALQAAALPMSYSGVVLERVVGGDSTASSMAPRRSAAELYPRKNKKWSRGQDLNLHSMKREFYRLLGSPAPSLGIRVWSRAALVVQAADRPTKTVRRRGRSRAPPVPDDAMIGGGMIGGGLRVRTPVLADPSVFETDCRPLQRSPP